MKFRKRIPEICQQATWYLPVVVAMGYINKAAKVIDAIGLDDVLADQSDEITQSATTYLSNVSRVKVTAAIATTLLTSLTAAYFFPDQSKRAALVAVLFATTYYGSPQLCQFVLQACTLLPVTALTFYTTANLFDCCSLFENKTSALKSTIQSIGLLSAFYVASNSLSNPAALSISIASGIFAAFANSMSDRCYSKA